MWVHEVLHIEAAGILVGNVQPGTVSLSVSIFLYKVGGFQNRHTVRSRRMLRVRAETVHHSLQHNKGPGCNQCLRLVLSGRKDQRFSGGAESWNRYLAWQGLAKRAHPHVAR